MKIKKSIFILMVIVLITILGTVLYKGEKYNLIIISSFALSCLPFYFKYENIKPKIREVVVLATMIALTVVSRTIFMLTPSFKPVTAMVIICGIVFGPASGYVWVVVSNIIRLCFWNRTMDSIPNDRMGNNWLWSWNF